MFLSFWTKVVKFKKKNKIKQNTDTLPLTETCQPYQDLLENPGYWVIVDKLLQRRRASTRGWGWGQISFNLFSIAARIMHLLCLDQASRRWRNCTSVKKRAQLERIKVHITCIKAFGPDELPNTLLRELSNQIRRTANCNLQPVLRNQCSTWRLAQRLYYPDIQEKEPPQARGTWYLISVCRLLRLQAPLFASQKANTTETYACRGCSSDCMSRGVGRARLCIKPLTWSKQVGLLTLIILISLSALHLGLG